ncbi:MAG TPA: hypothetical protein DD473_00480 [Planctomycetaceae bacterium]|nr:hypothetical protein [Planctomycetaceae bacterium]
MSFSLLNFGMLAGLLAVAVPVLVHLLNRRRFDVVEWGAMQFLQLGERTRQKIKLSDLLLLLMRMLMVAILVLVFTRPFLQGNLYIRNLYPEPIDLVIVIDSSYSMGWTGEEITPHARAIQSCHNILDNLTSVDRVAIIDARNRSELLTPAPLTDASTARLELEKLQGPDGITDMAAAITQACQLLTQSYSTRRDIVVLTDQQALSWAPPETASWSEFLKLRQAAAVPIQLSAIDVGSGNMDSIENYRVDRLKASRDITVVNSPVTISTRVGYQGAFAETEYELHWSVDGQQLSRESDALRLQNGEEAVAEITTRFADPGNHIITASLDGDALPGDNVAEIVLDVVDEVPVVIATNADSLTDPVNQDEPETEFYLSRVFGNPDIEKVWVSAKTVKQDQIDAALLDKTRVLFLLGPGPESMDWELLTNYLVKGGGLVLLPDRNSTAEDYQKSLDQWMIEGRTVLPVQFNQREDTGNEPEKLDLKSFSAAWLAPFSDPTKSELVDVLVTRYWDLSLNDQDLTKPTGKNAQKLTIEMGPAAVTAQLQNGSPVFVQRKIGRGHILVSSVAFDGAGSDLIRQRTFVPLMHELVFGMTRTTSERNLDLTQAIIVQQLPCQPLKLNVTAPDQSQLTAQRTGSGDQLTWRLSNLKLSGIYEVEIDCEKPAGELQANKEMPFYAFASREESDITRLSAEQKQDFNGAFNLNWRANSKEVLDDLATASGGIEIWPILLFIVTALLVVELLMTRRLVQGGHRQIELNEASLAAQQT